MQNCSDQYHVFESVTGGVLSKLKISEDEYNRTHEKVVKVSNNVNNSTEFDEKRAKDESASKSSMTREEIL